MKVGFTGTRAGMTGDQAMRYAKLVRELASYDDVNVFHFGLCVGSDQQGAEIASWFGYTLIGHPGDVAWKWAGHMPSPVAGTSKAVVLSSKPPLERDRDIVDVTEVLIATPKQQATPEFRFDPSVRRGSGTWYTIRYALDKALKPVWFVWPDGTAVHHAPA